MKIINRKIAYKGKYLKVIEKQCLSQNGKKFIWECVERHDAVFVFAVTRSKEVILEKIFRVPSKDYSIEMPAGLLDKKNEIPRVVAKRELLEETGYLAKKLIFISEFLVTPGGGSQKGFLFFAPNAELINGGNREDAEEIEIIKVPIKNLEKFLINQSKKIEVDLKILGVLALVKMKRLV